ncbi:ankyrin repeat-containing domain protein, partial [Diaporthe sp. PMI_573]
PLTSANLNSLPEMVKLLIEFGAKIDAANPEGLIALYLAAVLQNPEYTRILLAYGADTEYTSSNGYTPLITAIMHNSHAVLRLLLGSRASCLNSSLLSIIDNHADLETKSILASSQFSDLHVD